MPYPINEYAQQVGFGMMASNRLEYELQTLFCNLAKIDPLTSLRIWFAVDFRHQRDMLQEIANLKLSGSPVYGEFGRVLGEVKAANKTRNKLAHWVWAWGDEPLHQTITRLSLENRSGFKESHDEVEFDDLRKEVEQITATIDAVSHLIPKIVPVVEAWHETRK